MANSDQLISIIEAQQSLENGKYNSIEKIGPNAGNGNFSYVFTL